MSAKITDAFGVWGAFEPAVPLQLWEARALREDQKMQVLQLYDEAFEEPSAPSVLSDFDAMLSMGAQKSYVVTVTDRVLQGSMQGVMLLVQYEWGTSTKSDKQWVMQLLATQKEVRGRGFGVALLEAAGHIVLQDALASKGEVFSPQLISPTLCAYTRQQDHKTQSFYTKCAGRLSAQITEDHHGQPMHKVIWNVKKMLRSLAYTKQVGLEKSQKNNIEVKPLGSGRSMG